MLVDIGINCEDDWKRELEFFDCYGSEFYGIVVRLYVEVYVVLEWLDLCCFCDFDRFDI